MSKRKKGLNSDEDAGKTVDFGGAISQICEEKGIARDKVIETIEAALSAAYKKDYGKKGQNIRAAFNEKNGEAEFYLVKETVDETLREFPVEEEEAEVEEKESKKKTNLPALPTGRQTARQGLFTVAKGNANMFYYYFVRFLLNWFNVKKKPLLSRGAAQSVTIEKYLD